MAEKMAVPRVSKLVRSLDKQKVAPMASPKGEQMVFASVYLLAANMRGTHTEEHLPTAVKLQSQELSCRYLKESLHPDHFAVAKDYEDYLILLEMTVSLQSKNFS